MAIKGKFFFILGTLGVLCGGHTHDGHKSSHIGRQYFHSTFGPLTSYHHLVTAEDITVGHQWATYLYHLPPKFNADIWRDAEPLWASKHLRCLVAPCNASELYEQGFQYCDYLAEVPILMKMLLSLRFVENPSDADVFLVPALISSLGATGDAPIVYNESGKWFDELHSFLSYFNTSDPNMKPHIFLATRDRTRIPLHMQTLPYVATLGPSDLVVPSLNPTYDLQPSHYQHKTFEQRDTLVLEAFSLIYPVRHAIHKQIQAYNGSAKLGFHDFSGRVPGQGLESLMARSVFIICPAGDLPFQKRFFDALMCGAIPVVISVECMDGTTWFTQVSRWYMQYCPAHERSIQESYPNIPLHWGSLVEQISLDQLLSPNFNIVRHLESIPEEQVRAKLERIRSARSWFLYDYEGTAPDAFSLLLKTISRKVHDARYH